MTTRAPEEEARAAAGAAPEEGARRAARMRGCVRGAGGAGGQQVAGHSQAAMKVTMPVMSSAVLYLLLLDRRDARPEEDRRGHHAREREAQHVVHRLVLAWWGGEGEQHMRRAGRRSVGVRPGWLSARRPARGRRAGRQGFDTSDSAFPRLFTPSTLPACPRSCSPCRRCKRRRFLKNPKPGGFTS